MEFLADLHIHSRFSRATSREITPENLYLWSLLKGITVTGTGDFTHPGWFSEIRERLVEAEEGLFRLSGDLEREALKSVPEKCRGEVRFMLTAEISSIYKKNGKVRKIHNVVIMPSLDAAGAFSAKLARIGNVASDGRPILGLDARNLLELVLECSGDAIFIPAHIWTPWFSLFGSNSGFDSIEECFEDLTGEIFALETGLSSDPFMNRMLSALDRFTLVSNSDAHSCDKIGREANDFDCELDYSSIRNALKSGYPEKFRGTIEFFPEEGKYHLDGHRKCGARMRPGETFRLGGMCRVCGKPATVGVMNRVCRLADRKEGENVPFYRMLVPLKEVIGDTAGTGAGTKGVDEIYRKLLEAVGPEIFVLKDAPLDAVELASNPAVSRAIHKMREWDVKIEEGYDGEFGKVSILAAGERAELSGRSMFKGFESAKGEGARKRCGKIGEIPPLERPALFDRIDQSNESNRETAVKPEEILAGLNDEQRAAVLHEGAPLLIVAGPGTGKTKTLTSRIAYGIAARKMKPEECLAVTFTNKASEEMRKRLVATSSGRNSGGFNICTFHSLALRILRENSAEAGLPEDFKVIDPEGEKEFIAKLNKKYDWGLAKRGIPDLVNDFDRVKNSLDYGCMDEASSERFRIYRDELAASGAVDFGDLIIKSVELLENNGEILAGYRERFKSVYVDEYQDINPAQHRLLMALAAGCRDLMVIGDPDQSIYGFRGSSPEFFERFAVDFGNANVIRLRAAYRSTEVITSASQSLLGGGIQLIPQKKGGRRLVVYSAPTERSEAEFIVKTVETLVGGVSHFSIDSGRVQRAEAAAGKTGFADIAVLFRISALLPAIREAFDRSGIPYQIAGGKKEIVAPEESLDDYNPEADRVALMTMHASKGLEFKAVFIAGCEEGIIPFTMKEDCREEEEKRLFYVAMTRAAENLFISHASKRMLHGRALHQQASRYLSDIEAILKEEDSFNTGAGKREKQLSFF